jgi:hypothetical protein
MVAGLRAANGASSASGHACAVESAVTMPLPALPPLPGVDPDTAPAPDDPRYAGWVERAVFSPEGVDRALIWENLHRSPAERLEALQAYVDSFHAAVRTDPLR